MLINFWLFRQKCLIIFAYFALFLGYLIIYFQITFLMSIEFSMEKKQLCKCFKLSHKVAEVSHYMNSAFGEETTNENVLQRWF